MLTEDDSSEIVRDRRPFGFLSFFCFHDCHHAGSTENPGCFQSRPEKLLYIWPPLRKTYFRPEKRAYLWPAPAQSRRIKPLGSACRLFWGAGWRICQLRCPALRKDFGKSEDEVHFTLTPCATFVQNSYMLCPVQKHCLSVWLMILPTYIFTWSESLFQRYFTLFCMTIHRKSHYCFTWCVNMKCLPSFVWCLGFQHFDW